MKRRELISIGKIVNTHGIHGKVRVIYYGEDETGFFPYRKILLSDGSGNLESYEVIKANLHRKFYIVQFKDVGSVDQAERLVGASILVEKAAFPKLEAGEYYWADLIGMEVETVKGDRLGEVLGIIPTGGTDVFVIRVGEKELLVPATEAVIKQVDTASRRMIIDPLEGLLGDDPI